MINFLLKFFVLVHNQAYRVITKLAVKRNHGLHPKHQILRYSQFFLDNINSSNQILDIGCGNGQVAYELAQKAQTVVGIDKNEKNIQYAKIHFRRANLQFIEGDALAYKFINQFDQVVLSNVLEHISDRIAFLQGLHSLTNVILLRVPMLDRDWLAVYKKELGLEYRLDRTHYIEYTIKSLTNELKLSGWHLDNYSIQFGELWGVLKENYY